MSVKDFISYINTTQIHRIAVVFFIAFLGIGLGVGFSVGLSDARKAADNDYDRRLSIFSQWQMDLTSHFTKAASLAATMGSFAMATVSTPTNLSAPSADRMRYLNQEALDRLGSQVYISGISTMVLAPGGVITQMYPPKSANLGVDVLANPTYKYLLPILSTSSGAKTTGPIKLTTRPGYGAHVWFPIHINNVSTMENFWGVAFVLMEISVLLESLNMSRIMAREGMDYAMWFTVTANGTTPIVIAQSNDTNAATIISDGMRMRLPIAKGVLSSIVSPQWTGNT